MQVAVVWQGRKSAEEAGYNLLVEHLTGQAHASGTFYSIVRNWAELFLRDFSNYDAVLVHGASAGFWLPSFKERCPVKVILHCSTVKRQGGHRLSAIMGRRMEKRAVDSSDVLVADNKSIAGYLSDVYGRTADVIAYGGDHFQKKLSSVLEEDFLSECHMKPGSYALAMCHVAPENNCDVILEAFSRSLEPLMFIGDWESGDYAMRLRRKFGARPNILLLNQDEVPDMMYMAMRNCRIFVTGHSAEGTDPMLVGAMSLGKPVICYDSPSNRNATRDMAYYFRSFQDILRLIFIGASNGMNMYAIAKGMYDWKYIDKKYQALYER